MGVYSEVAIALKTSDADALVAEGIRNGIWRDEADWNSYWDYSRTVDGGRFTILYCSDVKWYDDFAWVKFILNFLRSHEHHLLEVVEGEDVIEENTLDAPPLFGCRTAILFY